MSTLVEYLEGRIDFAASGGCWRWTGAVKPNGYGSGGHRTTGTFNAHRMVYRTLVGEIPEGLDLEPVTRRENLRRGETLIAEQLAKSTCPRGHEYDETTPGGYRGCSICRKATMRATNRRRRAQGRGR